MIMIIKTHVYVLENSPTYASQWYDPLATIHCSLT